MSAGQFRLRVGYRKDGRLRFLGHLEVLRTIDRCVRRSGLPFAVTQGFSPHMRLQFSSALPVGASSACEWYDLALTEFVRCDEALARLAASTPVDLAPLRAGYVDGRVPALESWLARSRWEISLIGTGIAPGPLDVAIGSLSSAGSLEYLRGDRPKRVDLAQTLVSWRTSPLDGGAGVVLDTRSAEAGSLRPDVLLDAALSTPALAGAVISRRHVRRIGQWHEEDGGLVEPL